MKSHHDDSLRKKGKREEIATCAERQLEQSSEGQKRTGGGDKGRDEGAIAPHFETADFIKRLEAITETIDLDVNEIKPAELLRKLLKIAVPDAGEDDTELSKLEELKCLFDVWREQKAGLHEETRGQHMVGNVRSLQQELKAELERSRQHATAFGSHTVIAPSCDDLAETFQPPTKTGKSAYRDNKRKIGMVYGCPHCKAQEKKGHKCPALKELQDQEVQTDLRYRFVGRQKDEEPKTESKTDRQDDVA
jgi:hypothetical protein